MTRQVRHYTAEQRVEAIGLTMSVGVLAAARQLGIPHRTVSHWARNPTPQVQAAIVRSQEDVAARLWEAVVAGTEAVMEGLRDPKARLSDKARALEVVSQQHALLTGMATARTENANLNVDLADQMSDAEQRALVASLRREMDLRSEGPLTPDELADLRAYLDAQAKEATDGLG